MLDALVMRRLRRARLTIRQTLCLSLQSYEGLTQRAIAKRLGVSLSTVAGHISAARRKLHLARLKLRPLTTAPGRVIDMPTEQLDGIGPNEIKARW